MTNKELRRILSLYAELLRIHSTDGKLAASLSSAAYYTRRIKQNIMSFDAQELKSKFRPAIAKLIIELQKTSTITALDELIELTPGGLLEMMRIKGLGGKRISMIWRQAKIDTLEGLVKACKKNALRKIPGFGPKTENNIIKSIENYKISQTHFHYATLAAMAERMVIGLQRILNSKLISLCGAVRRCSLTLPGIEMIVALPPKQISPLVLKKFMIVKSGTKRQTKGITLDEYQLQFIIPAKPTSIETYS